MPITLIDFFKAKGMLYNNALFTKLRFKAWARSKELFPRPIEQSKKFGDKYDIVELENLWSHYLQMQQAFDRDAFRKI